MPKATEMNNNVNGYTEEVIFDEKLAGGKGNDSYKLDLGELKAKTITELYSLAKEM